MRAFIALLLLVLCHVALSRPFDSVEDVWNQRNAGRMIYKRGDPTQHELVMARLQELLGPEAFTEIDSHGRLSNLQRLG